MRKVELLGVFTGAVLGEQSTPLVGCLRADDQKPIRRSDEEFAWAQDNTAVQDLEQSVGRKKRSSDSSDSSCCELIVACTFRSRASYGLRCSRWCAYPEWGGLFADLPGVGAG